jgi:hypothetical protein
LLNESDGYSKADLPETHSILIYLTDEESGRYRIHGEGIFDVNQVIFVAPPEERVSILMKDLFEWLKSDIKTPMLVLYISLWVCLYSSVWEQKRQDCLALAKCFTEQMKSSFLVYFRWIANSKTSGKTLWKNSRLSQKRQFGRIHWIYVQYDWWNGRNACKPGKGKPKHLGSSQ